MTLLPGQKLQEVRYRLGVTTRDVTEHSQKIAEAEGNPEFHISNAWLTQVENGESVPSIFKLYSLSAIYRIKFSDLLMIFGVDLQKISKYEMAIQLCCRDWESTASSDPKGGIAGASSRVLYMHSS